jgi:4-hydroxy-tetrahydrodipicolinate synthase
MNMLAPGVWGVLATPFQPRTLAVDCNALARLTGLYQSLGASGVVTLGVFGEAARLTERERLTVVETVCEAARPLRVVAGIAGIATRDAVTEAGRLRAAAQGGLRAVMLPANSSLPSRVRDHCAAVYTATGLPVVVQDYPVASGVHIAVDALAEAVDQAPWAAAIKCESPPTAAVIAQLASRVSVPLFGGLGGMGLLDEMAAGAAGAMTGFSHPEALQDVITAWLEGGYHAARSAITPWLALINFEAQPEIGLAIRKENLHRRGLIESAAVRPPGRPLPRELAELTNAHWRVAAGLLATRVRDQETAGCSPAADKSSH